MHKSLQEIDVRMHCVKGVGKDHAKFSPVGMYNLYVLCYLWSKMQVLEMFARNAVCFNSHRIVPSYARDHSHATRGRQVSRAAAEDFLSRCY
jgi:hypothetical protein